MERRLENIYLTFWKVHVLFWIKFLVKKNLKIFFLGHNRQDDSTKYLEQIPVLLKEYGGAMNLSEESEGCHTHATMGEMDLNPPTIRS